MKKVDTGEKRSREKEKRGTRRKEGKWEGGREKSPTVCGYWRNTGEMNKETILEAECFEGNMWKIFKLLFALVRNQSNKAKIQYKVFAELFFFFS